MKNLLKNRVLIVILGVIVIVIAVFAVYRIMNPIYTFDDITNNKAELVAKIESQGMPAPEYYKEIIDDYKTQRFRKYSLPNNYGRMQYNETAHMYLECYDNDDNFLFEIEIYYADIFGVQVDGASCLYTVV